MKVTIKYNSDKEPIGWEMFAENKQEVFDLMIIRVLEFYGHDDKEIVYNGRTHGDKDGNVAGTLHWVHADQTKSYFNRNRNISEIERLETKLGYLREAEALRAESYKLTTPVDVFNRVLKTINREDFFICNCVFKFTKNLINAELYNACMSILRKHKPTADNSYSDIYESEHFLKDDTADRNSSWWDHHVNTEIVLALKRDYLVRLIHNLKSDNNE